LYIYSSNSKALFHNGALEKHMYDELSIWFSILILLKSYLIYNLI